MNKPQPVFALIDCNNFFVSCERIFRPELEGKPVIVLSSNDGCIVSRSNEAKALGIPMGAPAFQCRQIFKSRGVVEFSANFELYGDISRRIIKILTTVTPRTEVYSIDESFLDLEALHITDYATWGRALREHILRSVGVPVSIGIAPTKTLAKLGADYAKTEPALGGVLSLAGLSATEQETHLANFPLEDVWGVGRRLAPKLRAEGVHNALDLSRMRFSHARQLMGLSGAQMVSELAGTSCHAFGSLHPTPKTIMRGRTFGEDTSEFYVLEAAIASLTARAASQLRSEHLLARQALLYLGTNRHKPGFRMWCESVKFTMPTGDTGQIITALLKRLNDIYSPGQAYHRACVTLYDFVPPEALQIDLLGSVSPEAHDAATARMQAVDHINAKFGRQRIYYAAEDLSQSWQPKRQLRSPAYVSRWDELPETSLV
jgi:DNA polymerase V